MTTTDIDPPSGPMRGPRGGPDRWDRSARHDHHEGRGPDFRGMFARGEGWLDDRGRGAWIVATILGFVLFWPIGLFLLFYAIWSKRMFSSSCRSARHRHGHAMAATARAAMRPSGNGAFDAYKAATLRRLEEEQGSFEAFLERLREAKDKAEFDQFMDDRARSAGSETESRSTPDDGPGDDRDSRGGWTPGPMRPAD